MKTPKTKMVAPTMSNTSPIEPSVGRIVLVHGSVCSDKDRHVPAIVQRVWSTNCLNLIVMTDNGPSMYGSISYGEDHPEAGNSWFWMPYQKQQANV